MLLRSAVQYIIHAGLRRAWLSLRDELWRSGSLPTTNIVDVRPLHNGFRLSLLPILQRLLELLLLDGWQDPLVYRLCPDYWWGRLRLQHRMHLFAGSVLEA